MKLLVNLGDVDWLNHGGFFVFDTRWVEIVEPPPDDADEDTDEYIWTVYRLDAEKFKTVEEREGVTVTSYLVPECYGDEDICLGEWGPPSVHEEWFAKHLDGICSSVGCEREELVEELCSDNVVTRAAALQTLVGYFGAYEFDQYPLKLSRKDMKIHGNELYEADEDIEPDCRDAVRVELVDAACEAEERHPYHELEEHAKKLRQEE